VPIPGVQTKFQSEMEERIYIQAVLREVQELGLYIMPAQVIDRFMRLTGGSHREEDDPKPEQQWISNWLAEVSTLAIERPDGSWLIPVEIIEGWVMNGYKIVDDSLEATAD
jgi:hypothetical protein